MNRALNALLLIFFACTTLAFAEEKRIAIIKSSSAAPYQAAIDGLRAEFSRSGVSVKIYEYELPLQLPSSVQPQVIVAVGSKAVDLLAKTVSSTPVVYMMVMKQSSLQANITGISLDISPKQQLEMCRKIMPRLRRVGVLYDPGQTGELVEKYIAQARELDIDVLASRVAKIEDIYGAVRELGPRVDALWIVPDSTVYTPKTTEDILLYSLRQRLPVIGLSSSYVKAGALCSFSCSYKGIGMQTAQMVEKILGGQSPAQLAPEEPQDIETSVNLITAERIGIVVPENITRGAANVYQ
jgi:putative ABC transport system substrate-binding protein